MTESRPGNKDWSFQRQLDIALTDSREITSLVLPPTHVNITKQCFFDNQTMLPFVLGISSREISKPTPGSKKTAYLVFCQETSGVEISCQL